MSRDGVVHGYFLGQAAGLGFETRKPWAPIPPGIYFP
jgi:hypothetical protein